MHRPSVFSYVHDNIVNDIFSSNEITEKFCLRRGNLSLCWMEQLQTARADIAVIEINSFDQHDLAKFQSLAIAKSTLFMFFNDGQPNSYIDEIKTRFQSYHFRAPFDYGLITQAIVELKSSSPLNNDSENQKYSHSGLYQYGLLLGSSTEMLKLYKVIRKIAVSDLNVMINGGSGTGKELVAKTLHLFSNRASGPFIAINCAALSLELVESELFGHVKGAFTGAFKHHTGVFEQAEGGTLFLDEVAEMPIGLQVKLLRVLETGEFRPVGGSAEKIANVRIITATNQSLSQAIQNKLFRADLYFRLAHFPINVPALKHREKDIVRLAVHFVAHRNALTNQVKFISVEAQKTLQQYDWPGNVRQLKHAIERAFILADTVIKSEHLLLESFEEKHIHTSLSDCNDSSMALEQIERSAIEKTLNSTSGNKSQSAKLLGISVKTLYNKLEKYQSETLRAGT